MSLLHDVNLVQHGIHSLCWNVGASTSIRIKYLKCSCILSIVITRLLQLKYVGKLLDMNINLYMKMILFLALVVACDSYYPLF